MSGSITIQPGAVSFPQPTPTSYNQGPGTGVFIGRLNSQALSPQVIDGQNNDDSYDLAYSAYAPHNRHKRSLKSHCQNVKDTYNEFKRIGGARGYWKVKTMQHHMDYCNKREKPVKPTLPSSTFRNPCDPTYRYSGVVVDFIFRVANC